MLARDQLSTYAMKPLTEIQQRAFDAFIEKNPQHCPRCGDHKDWQGALGQVFEDFVVLVCDRCHVFPYLETTPKQVKASEVGIEPEWKEEYHRLRREMIRKSLAEARNGSAD